MPEPTPYARMMIDQAVKQDDPLAFAMDCIHSRSHKLYVLTMMHERRRRYIRTQGPRAEEHIKLVGGMARDVADLSDWFLGHTEMLKKRGESSER